MHTHTTQTHKAPREKSLDTEGLLKGFNMLMTLINLQENDIAITLTRVIDHGIFFQRPSSGVNNLQNIFSER